MSLWTRFINIFRSKANKVLDKVEDPGETLDYSYRRQLDMLTKTRRGLADVATSRKRLELQVERMNADAEKYTAQAQKAIDVGREDLAREALTRKAALAPQIADLTAQRDSLQAQEDKLNQAQEDKLNQAVQSLTSRVESFRVRKETVKATYNAAKAQTQIAESLTGIGGELGDVALAIQRAEDKTVQMQARAGAIDELLATGALDAPGLGMGDVIDRELAALSTSSDVETELAALKSKQRPELEA